MIDPLLLRGWPLHAAPSNDGGFDAESWIAKAPRNGVSPLSSKTAPEPSSLPPATSPISTGGVLGAFPYRGLGILGNLNGWNDPLASSSSASQPSVSPNFGVSGDLPSQNPPVHLAQALTPLLPPLLFARPPLILPRQLTPLEELPPGSSGGQGAGRAFPRLRDPNDQEGVPCIYCGEPTTRKGPGSNRLHRDHIIPKSRGGNNSPENKGDACQTCNLDKGARTPEEWYEWMRNRT